MTGELCLIHRNEYFEEAHYALKAMKNRKALGIDGIQCYQDQCGRFICKLWETVGMAGNPTFFFWANICR